jgi:hypothetical protein
MKFSVKASVAIAGTFDKWDASLTFSSTDVATGVLDIKTQADSDKSIFRRVFDFDIDGM